MVDDTKIGTRLRMFTREGVFEGIVHSTIKSYRGSVVLQKVIDLNTGKQLKQQMRVFPISDIDRCEVVGEGRIGAPSYRRQRMFASNRLFDMCLKEPRQHLDKQPHVKYSHLAAGNKLGPVLADKIEVSSGDDLVTINVDGINDGLGTEVIRNVDGKNSDGSVSKDVNGMLDETGSVTDTVAGESVDSVDCHTDAGIDAGHCIKNNEKTTTPSVDISTATDVENVHAKQSPTVVMIDEMTGAFSDALADINSQKMIGLACQGMSLGRDGLLCFLQIATADNTYVFDMLKLGHEIFDNGLREVLAGHHIQKVTYNCRCLSDILYHQYNVVLDHVFDCQVAYILLLRSRYAGKVPRHLGSLGATIRFYLRLPANEIFFERLRLYSREDDELVWGNRPVSPQVLDAANKNVVYLCRLRRVMLDKMFAGLVYGTNIYLRVQRSQSDEQANERHEDNKLPPEFVLGMRQQSDFFETGSIAAFIDNCDASTRDPYIGLAHDGISHCRNPETFHRRGRAAQAPRTASKSFV